MDWIVMFAKAPVPGKVKTRLAVKIGDVLAAQFHQAFIADMFEVMRAYQASRSGVMLALALSGDQRHEAFDPLIASGVRVLEQGEGDLGDRLKRVSHHCFEEGARRLVITGSDSPTLCMSHYVRAFERLDVAETQVVFGPSFDGGYYLVGMNEDVGDIFKDVPWSQPNTLRMSMERVEGVCGRLCALLDFWYDVDNFEDLKFLSTHIEYLRRQMDGINAFEQTYKLLSTLDNLWC